MEETVNIEATLANAFGTNPEDVEILVRISDLAANVKFHLERDEIDEAASEMNMKVNIFRAEFLEMLDSDDDDGHSARCRCVHCDPDFVRDELRGC